MIVRKIEVDPVSNRRKVFLLALTAGICFAVFVGISLESPALPADGNNSTCTKLQQMMFPATFDAGRLDFLKLRERTFFCVFVKISLANTMVMWILAGSALLIVLTQLSALSLDLAAQLSELSTPALESFSLSFGILSQQHVMLITENWIQVQHSRS